MTHTIEVQVLYSARKVESWHIDAARTAADDALFRAGLTAKEACDEYSRQDDKFDGDRYRMTGAAVAWINAEQAAQNAYTTFWRDPNEARIRIRLA